jgi:bacteriocin biosynthesis cyclodehydratase domain-containing protein
MRLDPAIPVVWRDPHTIQLGVDRPLRLPADDSTASERMLHALQAGVLRAGLEVIGTDAGATPAQVADFVRRISPVLTPPAVASAGRVGTVALEGDADELAYLRRLLPHVQVEEASQRPDLAVVFASYVVPPQQQARWLRRDTPHLPVIFSDQGVEIGPLIEPGIGPCLRCLWLNRTDADPAWPAIGTQLAGRTAPTKTPLVLARITSDVAVIVRRRLESGRDDGEATSTYYDVSTATVSVRRHRPHPACGCRALPGNVTALPSGHDRRPSAPSSSATVDARA